MHDGLKEQRVILFDGVCNLCNASVVFVLQHEQQADFNFASIQSETGKDLLNWSDLPPDYAEAVILIDKGKIYSGCTAALKIGQTLKFPWSFVSYAGFIVPKFLRDWVYSQIAKHRYDLLSKSWFGKRDVCMVPTHKLQSRFTGN
jgi:predicted DCC family thiol-disulfide oxidoreductase YuxK